MTINVPDAPVLTSIAPGSGTNTLTWTTPNGNGSTITGYNVYRSTTSGQEIVLATVGVVNTYSDTGLVNGTQYFYKVAATYTVGTSGTGVVSTESSGTPQAAAGSLDTPGASGQLVEMYVGMHDVCGFGNAPGDPGTWATGTFTYVGNGAGGLGWSGLGLSGENGPWAITAGAATGIQAAWINGGFTQKCHNAGLTRLYLQSGTNQGATTPFKDWFDDAAWNYANRAVGNATGMCPLWYQFAGCAKLLGFTGIFFDCEFGDWAIAYSGNTHTGAQTQAQAKLRGQQLMQSMLDGWAAALPSGGPQIELSFYHLPWDGDYAQLFYHTLDGRSLNGISTTFLYPNFIDGLSSLSGWGKMHFMNSSFYGDGIGNDETDLLINANATMATMSQQLSNWSYANNRMSAVPFRVLGPEGVEPGVAGGSPATASSRGANAHKWAMSGEFYNYASYAPQPLNHANFVGYPGSSAYTAGNYEPAYQAITPSTVDTVDPTLSNIVITRDSTSTVHATGRADDNFGIRAIRWVCGTNSGAAVHTFVADTTIVDHGVAIPDYTQTPTNFHFHATWIASGIPATGGQTVQFTVEDIKGHTASYSVMAPAGATEFVDSFIRTNNTNISTNAPWSYTFFNGSAAIVSNQCQDTNTTVDTDVRAEKVLASVDHHCQITIGTIVLSGAANVQCGAIVRADATAKTYYEAHTQGGTTSQVHLLRLAAGSETEIGVSSGSFAPKAGDTLKLSVVGSTITVSYNGTQVVSVTDTVITTGFRCGFHLSRPSATDIRLSELRMG